MVDMRRDRNKGTVVVIRVCSFDIQSSAPSEVII